ncbi:acid-sensing ion channel 1C [Octopus bimaculoides]|nr:acid-sensing ion channel 1C [Octopus bimaculoides]|eukprot:XP_014782111.1 PREDICTED: acid-sensing ion channel 1-like [Octopus bimaculoides]
MRGNMNFRWPSFIRNDKTGDTTQGKSWIDYISEKIHFDKKQHVSSLGNELYKKEKSYTNSQNNLIQEEKKEKDATKSLLMHFSNNTSLHGVRNIADSNNTLLRLFYIGIVASFMILVSYYLIKLFMIYNSHPVNRQYTASLQEKLMFPGITMCDFHPYNLRNQSIFVTLIEGLDAKNYTNPLFSLEEETIYTLLYSDQNDDLESKFNSNELCADDWSFRWMVIDNDILKCYTFNTVNKTEPRITNKPGIKYGLEIVRNFSDLYRDYTTGVRLTLLGYPYHPIEEDCVSVEKQSLLDNTSPYSQVICEEKCRVDFIIRSCNCSPSFAGGNNRRCTFREYITCERSATDEFFSNKSHLNMCNCIRSCSFTSYSISTSVAYYPRPAHKLPTKFKIHLYYESLILKEMSEQEMFTSEAFLAQFGGQMGLFLGASLITALELVELIIMVLWTQFRCLPSQAHGAGFPVSMAYVFPPS